VKGRSEELSLVKGRSEELPLVGETLRGEPALSEKWILQICGQYVVLQRSISVLVGRQVAVVTVTVR